MKLTKGFKFFLLALVLVGGVIGLRIYKPEYFQKKDAKSSDNTAAAESTKPSKKGVKADLSLGINTWSGFAPIVWLNGGLEPNENSVMYKKYGIKLRIYINDAFDNSRDCFKNDKYNLLYCTTDVLPTENGVGSGMVEAGARQILQVDWSRGGDAIVARKGINSVADFKGKTIAVALGTASHTLLIKVLETNGLTVNDVILKPVGDGIEAATFFISEAVDIAVTWSPQDGECVSKRAGSKVIVNTKVATHIIADGILVKESFLNEEKDMIVKFATAWLEANGTINTSESALNEAAQAFASAFKIPVDEAVNGLHNVRLTTLGDNKDFFGLNPLYQGMTGEQLYTKMSIVYSGLGRVKGPLPWRSVSNTSVIESINLTVNQEPESAIKFTAASEQVKTKAAMSNKKVTINFETGKYTLTDDDKATIDKEFVNIAKSFAQARIRIEGNTDAVGDIASNKVLSLKRAQSVANYLANEYQFDRNRFIVVGNGSSKAIADGVTGEDVSYRRTDFELVEE